MGEWTSALLFGLALLSFVLGFSSVIMGFIEPKAHDVIKRQVEYGFFGVAGIIFSLIFVYAMS